MSLLQRVPTMAPTFLRLFTDDSPAEPVLVMTDKAEKIRPIPLDEQQFNGPSGSWSLSQFWTQHYRAIKAVASKTRNLDEYDAVVKLWSEMTTDPPLAQINETMLAQWIEALGQRTGRKAELLTSATISKYARTMQAILYAAGPRQRGKYGARAITEVPYVTRPRLIYQSTDEDCLTLVEIKQLLTACQQAPRPTKQPAVWWQSLIQIAYYTGLRLDTLLCAQWSWLHTDELGTWIKCPPGTIKARSSTHWCYVPSALSTVIERLRRVTGRNQCLLPWPFSRDYFQNTRREIWLLSGLPADRRAFNAVHSIRACAATELAKINGLVVPLFLGHATQSVSLKHYVQRQALATSVEQLPPLIIKQ